MSSQYKKFLRLLESWPVDTTKPGRNLGEYLRKQLKASLRAGNDSFDVAVSMDKQFQALERISNNVHFNKYSRLRQSTATGLNSEQCKIMISETSLNYFAEQSKGPFINFVKNKLQRKK
ncbi:ubiquinol-cytochrome-c reductase complex assembly factor 2-like [Contarinia nasturtii]|uniref:ubiquinol-cytochrome-c reductase complex assembly factor 2-like n=1 Tax=Contarinia nasturtii TaxID=265458 RepID=UPI0012D3AF31|nr:ubiquinol-cytochrome-c reductase complex assembly factor 2-like [Contarinia nasturtii]